MIEGLDKKNIKSSNGRLRGSKKICKQYIPMMALTMIC